MMYGIRIIYLKKLFFDQIYVILSLTLFCLLFEYLYTWLLFESAVSDLFMSYIELIPESFSKFIGVEVASKLFSSQMLAFGYVHPMVLIILSILPISLPSRYISGEIEIKTFDIFLTKSIRRFEIPINLYIFLLFVLMFQMTAIFMGTFIGYYHFELDIDITSYAKIALTGYFFFTSMGAIALATASFQNERGKALTRIIGIMVLLYFFDTICRLSDSLNFLQDYSYFQLYQPSKLLMEQSDSTNCILISLVITILSLGLSLYQFNRRDL